MKLSTFTEDLNTLFLALFLSLTLTACVHRLPSALRHSDPSQVLARTASVEARIQSLKEEARLTVHSPDAKGTTTLFLAVGRPARLHVEVLDFFGKPSLVLVSNGSEFGLYEAQAGVYYQGPATEANVSRFLPIRLPPESLVALLLGEAPRLSGAAAAVTFDASHNSYVVDLTREEARQTLTVSADDFRVQVSDGLKAQGYRAEFSEFTRGSALFPKRLRLQAPSASTTLDLRHGSYAELNVPLDPLLFEPKAPANVRVVLVDGEGKPR